VAVGRAERWAERKPRVVAIFGEDAEMLRSVETLFELLELAWHDVYGEITPSEQTVDEVLLCSQGTLAGLIEAARVAVVDRRDLLVWADALRAQTRPRRGRGRE
jgi:hypothetical protein